MLVSDLISRIRTRVNDTQAIEFSDQELINYINDILSSISLYLASVRWQGVLQQTVIQVTAGSQNVSPPSNFLKEEAIYWYDPSLNNNSLGNIQLAEIHPALINQNSNNQPNTPGYYFMQGGIIYLYPIPNNNGTLTINYYPLLSVALTTDTIPLPPFFTEVLVHAVSVQALSRIELNPNIEAQLESYIYTQIRQFLNISRSWVNSKKMRAL